MKLTERYSIQTIPSDGKEDHHPRGVFLAKANMYENMERDSYCHQPSRHTCPNSPVIPSLTAHLLVSNTCMRRCPTQNVGSIAQQQHRAIFTKVCTSVFRWVNEQRGTLLGIHRRIRSKNAQSSTTWKESHEKSLQLTSEEESPYM